MQHFGLPIRLLDWTESELVAIYFAVRDYPSENCRLFAFSPHKLNERQSGIMANFTTCHPHVRDFFLPPFNQDAQNPEKIAAFMPKEGDARMLLQQSGFTVHGTAPSLEEPIYHNEILIKWDIPCSANRTIRAELSALGINESTLFPELEHLAKHMAGQIYRFSELE